MSAHYDSSKELLRNELATRIRECLVLRDWNRMEYWARQWIQAEPKSVNGFKWLARASIGLRRLQKASYSYSRVLDFEPENEEALQFFADHPSTLIKDERSMKRVIKRDEEQSKKSEFSPDQLNVQTIGPQQRKELAQKCLELGDLYFQSELYGKAAEAFKDSFDWHASRPAALGTARSLHRSKQSAKAVQFLKNCLSQQGQWIQGRLLLGKIFFEMGQSSEAQRSWQAVLKLEPDNKDALNYLRHLL